jgi:heme A synthase
MSRVSGLSRFAWTVLAYNVAVIAWGAFVRATGSGAGCGRHWPLCNGEVVPRAPSAATMIEASHRVTSGIALLLVVALLVACVAILPRGHRARKSAAFATAFVFGEAIIGAGLVLFELVAHDASMKRGLSMILHLDNTFLLLGALALTAWWIPGGTSETTRVRAPFVVRALLFASLLAVLVLASSGAIAALGDTLFPPRSIRDGLAQDVSQLAHLFVRLRVLHPVIALVTGGIVLAAAGATRLASTNARARSLSRALTVLFVVQFAAGLLNVTLLAPVPMQLVHLLLADAMWIVLVLTSWEAVGAPARVEETTAVAGAAAT